MKWYLEVLKKYAVFSGRARRKEYWMFFLFNLIVNFILGFIEGLLGAALHINLSFITILYTLAVFIPVIAVAVRRMHDIGRSGWWILFPIVNIIFLFINGEPHENRFGPDPKTVS
jgi:uncharacterized membrane protein YhaH (DUF805 family)